MVIGMYIFNMLPSLLITDNAIYLCIPFLEWIGRCNWPEQFLVARATSVMYLGLHFIMDIAIMDLDKHTSEQERRQISLLTSHDGAAKAHPNNFV